jgi:hypothetical protein
MPTPPYARIQVGTETVLPGTLEFCQMKYTAEKGPRGEGRQRKESGHEEGER